MRRTISIASFALLVACGGGQKQGAKSKAEPTAATAGEPAAGEAAAPSTSAVEAGGESAAEPAPQAEAKATQTPRTTAEFANIFFTHLAGGDYAAATAMFHLPPTFTPEEAASDKAVISKWLQTMTEELGKVIAKRTPPPATGFQAEGIGGGTEVYWADKDPPVQLILEVDYEKEGLGYVILGFCHIDGKVELQTMAFGLPDSREDATARMQEIGAKAR